MSEHVPDARMRAVPGVRSDRPTIASKVSAKEFVIMAKPNKNKNKNGKSNRKPAPTPSRAAKSSPVRNTPVPKGARRTIADGASAASSKPLTHEIIAERAYFISISGNGGSEHENWMRAERELRGI